MLTVDQAEQVILKLISPFAGEQDSEIVPLSEATGRILAAAVTSNLDFPHWDNSAMDGYAVRQGDLESCSPENPITLQVIEEIPAGYQPQRKVQARQAARILTGSVMPDGADTVVMQEETHKEGDRVTIMTSPKLGAFVRRKGEFYQAGATLLPVGLTLQATELAVLAAAQCAEVKVYRRPKVAILSTGSELVGIDQPLQPGQIVDSNQYALATLIAQTGAVPLQYGIVPDDPEKLRQAMANAIAAADVVISSGGVSVGDYDYVEKLLESLGGEIHIRAVAMKPGKPLTVATFGGKADGKGQRAEAGSEELRVKREEFQLPSPPPSPSYPPSSSSPSPSSPLTLYFGLPGNPVSALVTFWRFVQPAIQKLSGLPESSWSPTFVRAKARSVLRSDGKRESYLWGRLYLSDGLFEFDLVGGSHSSGNLINLAGINGLAVLPIGQTQVAAGETILVMQVGSPLIGSPLIGSPPKI